jgi:hypothetical protein
MKPIKLLVISLTLFISAQTFAQCDTIATICSKNIPKSFISDGQSYRALLLNDEVAEFHTTLYGGTVYRIAACSGMTNGNLIFRLFDEERNLLYSNERYKNAPYWDFDIKSTMDCIIETQLDPTSASSGCAVLLIGFQQ